MVRILSSEASPVNTALDDDAGPVLIRCILASSSDDFRSNEGSSTYEPSTQGKLPNLVGPIDTSPDSRRDEAQLLDEEAVFSQYLRSPSLTCSDVQNISDSIIKNSINLPLPYINPEGACLLPQTHRFTESISHDRVKSRGNLKSPGPRTTLRLHPPKPSPRPTIMLRLGQPRRDASRKI